MVLRENNQGHSLIVPLHLLTLFVIPTRNLEIGERDMPLSTGFSKVQASQSEEEDDEGSFMKRSISQRYQREIRLYRIKYGILPHGSI